MKVKDFEKAIDALSADITIDEMKIHYSDVRQVYAHIDTMLIVWDEYGRSFSASKEGECQIFRTEEEDGGIVAKSGVAVTRDKSFDLKFE